MHTANKEVLGDHEEMYGENQRDILSENYNCSTAKRAHMNSKLIQSS